MSDKQKRAEGGAWEYSALFADLEQRARIAADTYDAILVALRWSHTPMIIGPDVHGNPPSIKFVPPSGDDPTIEALTTAQQLVRLALADLLEGIGMTADAALIRRMTSEFHQEK